VTGARIVFTDPRPATPGASNGISSRQDRVPRQRIGLKPSHAGPMDADMDDANDKTPILRMRPAAPTWVPRHDDQPVPIEDVIVSVRLPKAPRLPSNIGG
jgi:hypothetical protein